MPAIPLLGGYDGVFSGGSSVSRGRDDADVEGAVDGRSGTGGSMWIDPAPIGHGGGFEEGRANVGGARMGGWDDDVLRGLDGLGDPIG